MLKVLTESGFSLERAERVQLLRSIEEIGGLIDFAELCEILFKSCVHWSEDEKSIVSKVLSAMGSTLGERRLWMAHFQQDLVYAVGAELIGEPPSVFRNSSKLVRGKKIDMKSKAASAVVVKLPENIEDSLTQGVAPSLFLKTLKSNGVLLNVKEEAALLDCLDAERAISTHMWRYSGGPVSPDAHNTVESSNTLVDYKSFLRFCSRHVGHWSDSFPELNEYLRRLVRSVSHPLQCINELGQLLQSFEGFNGTNSKHVQRVAPSTAIVSERAFLICCSRSRLLADLPTDLLHKLANILSTNADGVQDRIHYVPFLIHLQALSGSSDSHSLRPASDGASVSISSQLLTAVLEKGNRVGGLKPLRAWLVNYVSTCSLNDRELTALLKHFSIAYRTGELNDFQEEIICRRHELEDESVRFKASFGTPNNFLSVPDTEISPDDLISLLQKKAGPWTHFVPQTVNKIYKAVGMAFRGDDEEDWKHGKQRAGADSQSSTLRRVRVITSKLRAFSENNMVDMDIFRQVVHAQGVLLTHEEIEILSDLTDCRVHHSRVRASVLTEAVLAYTEEAHAGGEDSWKVALRSKILGIVAMHQTPLEVFATALRNALRGFDMDNSGVVSRPSFFLALKGLKIDAAEESVPASLAFIAYQPFMDFVLRREFSRRTEMTESSLHSLSSTPEKENGKHVFPPVAVEFLRRVKHCLVKELKTDNEDEVFSRLLEVFVTYDADETFLISSLHFQRAVAVLLKNDSRAIPSKDSMLDIISCFSLPSTSNRGTPSPKVVDMELKDTIDYMKFCDEVVKAELAAISVSRERNVTLSAKKVVKESKLSSGGNLSKAKEVTNGRSSYSKIKL